MNRPYILQKALLANLPAVIRPFPLSRFVETTDQVRPGLSRTGYDAGAVWSFTCSISNLYTVGLNNEY